MILFLDVSSRFSSRYSVYIVLALYSLNLDLMTRDGTPKLT